MKYSHLIFDCSNLYYKNFFVMPDLSATLDDKTILPTGGIYGFIRSLNRLKKEFLSDNGDVYIVFDNFSSQDTYRKTIDPDYKLNRKKYSTEFYRGLDYLNLILLNSSNKYRTVKIPTMEADDVIPSIIKLFDKRDYSLVISDDLDYARVISETTHWYKGKEVYTIDKFKEKYNFAPTENKVILWKVIRGDSSDEIPIGVKGIRENILLKLMDEYKDIYDILENINKIDYLGKYKEQFIENKSRLILNHQLVSFLPIGQEILLENIYKGEFNPNTLRSFFKILNFKSTELCPELGNSFPEKTDNSFFVSLDIGRK